MTDFEEPRRLIDADDDVDRALLGSAALDQPSKTARRAAAVALGVSSLAPTNAAAATKTSILLKGSLAVLVTGGVVVGAMTLRSPTTPPETLAPVELAQPPTVPAPVEATPDVEQPKAVEVVAPVAKPVVKRRPKPANGLAEEVRLLDRARTANRNGRHESALRALVTYRKKFPTGTLAEEADALRVTILAEAGRTAEASGSAREFFERYPDSSHAVRLRALVE